MSLTFYSLPKESNIVRAEALTMPEVLASTCGTLLSSQGSDAHLTPPSPASFGATVLIYSPRPSLSTRLIGVSPGWRGPLSYLRLGALATDLRCDGVAVSGDSRGLLQSCGKCFPRRQQGRHYGLVSRRSNRENLGRVAPIRPGKQPVWSWS